MKGGITSGVIYPRLVEALSKVYDFRSIGGTSAGAIAAAGAAAAQLGVRSGANPTSFAALGRLPEELGGPAQGATGSMLLNLFQPQAEFRGHFAILLGSLGNKSPGGKVLTIALTAIRHFPKGAAIGALPGLLLLPFSWGFGTLIAIALLLLGIPLGALANALKAAGQSLPSNAFGLCNGMPGETTTAPALTPWLHSFLNRLAGKIGDEPLTFGELWLGRLRTQGEKLEMTENAARTIDLAMMTTGLNMGRPFRLPFETKNTYFAPAELHRFFPASVIAWMQAHARPFKDKEGPLYTTTGAELYPLPDPQDFPVVVAVRLSLSFPLLLSALPLYKIDWTRAANSSRKDLVTGVERPPVPTRVYFSDGGICSNFPIHFFDSALPTRPTFGVNLKDFHPDHPDERVFLPAMIRNNQGIQNHVPEVRDEPGLKSVGGFVGSIIRTMQRWRDESQLTMPGFRDRIVHVSHDEKEGGMNLNMDPQVIDNLAAGGALAAQEFLNSFATPGGPGNWNAWDNHQRLRLRTLLSQLQQMLDDIDAVLSRSSPDYLAVAGDDAPPSYRYPNEATRHAAQRSLTALQALAQELKAQGIDLKAAAPRPEPELRIVPRA